MGSAMTFNAIDVIALLIILLTIWMGARSGLAVQAFAILGFAAGVLLLVVAAPYAAPLLEDLDPPLRGLVVLLVMATVVLVVQGIGSEIGTSVRRQMGYGLLGGLDRAAGGVFGVARGIFMVWLLGGLLAVAPVPALATEARQSLALRALDAYFPSPLVLAAEFGRAIQAAGLPDVFAGLPPPPAEPVEGPDQQAADAIAQAARASTVRVEGVACARFMTGTGFAVAPQHMVTNAHVIAGADRVWVSRDGSLDRHPATVVHYDPDLDAALLHVPGLELAPLELATGSPRRGTTMAALGFTGGGRQRAIPAAVTRSMEALGRDIYGRQVISRQVVELRADVAPGDSGGPVMLEDGTVGGVTFSESREDPTIGYALSPVAVADSIRGALSRTQAVNPGECLPGI
ncbi:MAG TPA: MarP family serine protease [Candidatus Limnocylindrales bacterium]|nr:MarP family serine protease [Candidatus Limnocylindrales bacterium]